MRLLTLVLLSFCTLSWAVMDTYQFDNEQQEALFHELVEELRCPKCQNQNLADSNSKIASDLRAEVYRLLRQGKSKPQITQYLVDRYGEFVRYKPTVNQYTLWLWLGPLLMLLIGLCGAIIFAKQHKPAIQQTIDTNLSPEEKIRLQQLTEDDV